MVEGFQDLGDAIRKIIFGYTDEEKKSIPEDIEEGRKKRDAKLGDSLTVEAPSGGSLIANWIPLVLVGILFFFVIKD